MRASQITYGSSSAGDSQQPVEASSPQQISRRRPRDSRRSIDDPIYALDVREVVVEDEPLAVDDVLRRAPAVGSTKKKKKSALQLMPPKSRTTAKRVARAAPSRAARHRVPLAPASSGGRSAVSVVLNLLRPTRRVTAPSQPHDFEKEQLAAPSQPPTLIVNPLSVSNPTASLVSSKDKSTKKLKKISAARTLSEQMHCALRRSRVENSARLFDLARSKDGEVVDTSDWDNCVALKATASATIFETQACFVLKNATIFDEDSSKVTTAGIVIPKLLDESASRDKTLKRMGHLRGIRGAADLRGARLVVKDAWHETRIPSTGVRVIVATGLVLVE